MNPRAPERLARPARARFGEEGYRSYPQRYSPLALAIRLCRHIESQQSLAALLKKVPEEYVEDGTVSCRCGEKVTVDEHWTFCSCGRVFTVGDDGVWAARLPAGEES